MPRSPFTVIDRIRVGDTSVAARRMAESGRGPYLISTLARRMSIHPSDAVGKRISITLELPLGKRHAALVECGRPSLQLESRLRLAPRVVRYRDAHGRTRT